MGGIWPWGSSQRDWAAVTKQQFGNYERFSPAASFLEIRLTGASPASDKLVWVYVRSNFYSAYEALAGVEVYYQVVGDQVECTVAEYGGEGFCTTNLELGTEGPQIFSWDVSENKLFVNGEDSEIFKDCRFYQNWIDHIKTVNVVRADTYIYDKDFESNAADLKVEYRQRSKVVNEQ